jgi:hypothetical protein
MIDSHNLLDYYACPGRMTDPKESASLLDGLPTDVSALCKVLQGIMLHIFWAERYGMQLSKEREGEVQWRSVVPRLARVRELDDRPLTMARLPDKCVVGNCRDYATLLTAILRHQDVPARARCGFGVYFVPNHYEDHWVTEYWNAAQKRWVLVDAQLDQLMLEALKIRFDPLDVPRNQFIVAGQAWQMCRSGQANPDDFGIFQWHGLWFVRGYVVRDLLSLIILDLLTCDVVCVVII